ncbi:tetratricopeptide repeat-containing sulfotransferase family protein [Microbulbifer epialgicus]|uniref:Sulfotransferase n=1 Tax=Microbulbifer epialgicus TaxID=393907 RepID=A0ABV4P2K6_9GAMM
MKHRDTPSDENHSRWKKLIKTIESELKCKNYVSAYSQLLKLSPSSPSKKIQTLSMLAFTSRHLNKKSEALNYLKQAELVSNTTQADRKFIAAEYVALGSHHCAIATIKKIEPMDGQTFHLLGISYFTTGDVGKALPIYKKLFSHLENNATIACELSLVAAKFRDYDTAIKAYTRYMQLIVPSAADHLKFSDLLLMGKKVNESQSQLRKSIQMGEKSSHTNLLQAQIDRLNGKYNESIRNAKQASLKNPKCGAAWRIIAELTPPEEITGQLAIRLKKAISSHAENSHDAEISHFALSEIYIKQGKYLEAYKQMIKANKVKLEALKNTENTYKPKMIEKSTEKTIETFNSPFTKLPTSCNQYRPIFIVGMPRSGTTLISKLIENSGNARNLGESEEIPRIASQLQLKFGEDTQKNLYKLTEADLNQLSESYLQAEKIREEETVDKMPSNFQHVGLILSLFPRARIIQLSRRPFDVCMSIFSKPFPDGHTYACKVQDTAHYYYQSKKLMQFWSKAFPKSVFNLNFDNFLAAPSKTATRMFEFLDFEWKESYLSQPVKSNSFTFSELQVRQPINPNEAKKWRNFNRIAADLNKAIDYESKRTSDESKPRTKE